MKWKMIPLNSICRPKQWKTLSMDMLKENGYPVYGANGKIGFYDEFTHELPTLMISCRGAGCGSMHISEPFSYINGNAMALDQMSEDYDLKYLYYYFVHIGFHKVISGSAQPQITREGLSSVEVPMIEKKIQQKIAAILDEADALRRKDKALLAKYDELLQSVFYDMFGDPVKNEKGWEVKKLGELCTKITDGEHTTPIRQENGIKLLSARNIKNGYIDFDAGLDYIGQDEYSRISKRCKPERDDVLMSCSGSVGRVTTVEIDEAFSLVRSVALLKLKTNMASPKYLEFFLRSDYGQNQIFSKSKKSSQANIFTGPIKQLNIVVPTFKLQEEFALIVQKIEHQKSQIIQQQTHSEALFQSLMQRAFKGELVG